ncbi:MAG: XRE family transcriptional regulator, partial [bacterium]
MEDQLKQIALRIREIREIEGITQETLASELGISAETYARYEAGETDISVSVLYQIANRFNVELSAILTGDNPRLHTYALARKGKGISVQRRKEYQYQSLAFNFAHKKAEPFLVTVPPEADNTPFALNSHPGQEFNYVISGTLNIFIDGHEIVLNEGDSIYFDSGVDHGMKALNNQS